MKNILLLISCLFIFGCGIKKDLATANESNTTLTEKVKELESKNQELAAENQKLRGIASSNRAEIMNLRNKKRSRKLQSRAKKNYNKIRWRNS